MSTISSVAIALSTDVAQFSTGLEAAKGDLGSFGKFATVSASQVSRTFGDQAEGLKSFASGLAQEYGNFEGTITKAANEVGKTFKQMGADADQAAKLSTSVLRLGDDLAKLGAADLPGSIELIKDAMIGGDKAAKAFGFTLTDAEVKAHALASGLGDANGHVSDLAKAQARGDLATRKIAAAMNDAKAKSGLLGASITKLGSAFKVARGGISGLASGFSSLAKLGGVTALLGAGAVYGLGKIVKAGGEVEDKLGRLRFALGDSSKGFEEFADKMGRAYGASKSAILEAGTGFANALQGIGATQEESAQYGEAFTRLANDMSTAFGGDIQSNLNTLQGAITGNVSSLKQFGIQIEDWEVTEKAYSMGLADASGNLTEFGKAQAAAALVVERSGDVWGAAAKDADGSTAQFASFQGQVQNLVETFQAKLAPIIAPLFGQMAEGVIYISEVWDSWSATIQSWLGDSLGAFEGFSGGMNLVETGIGALANAWQWVDIAFKGVQTLVNKGLAGMVKGLGWLVKSIDKMLGAVGLGETGMAGFFDAWSDEMTAKADESARKLKDAWNAPYASESVSEQFAKIRAETDKLREELAQKPLLPGVRLDDKDRPTQGVSFGSALTLGSAGAASSILTARFGGRDGVAANTKRTADLAEQALQVQRDTLAAIGGLGGLTAAAI